jgi:hypothetical protein
MEHLLGQVVVAAIEDLDAGAERLAAANECPITARLDCAGWDARPWLARHLFVDDREQYGYD